MHEGDHGILDDDHEHHSHEPDHRGQPNRLIAIVVVAAGVLLFLAWRFF